MAPVQDQNQVEDPFTATIALLETHRAAGNRSLSRSEPLRKLAAFLKTRIEAPPSDEIIDPRLETVTKLVDAFLKQESTNSEWTETVKLACSVRIRGLVLELRAKGLGQAEAHSRILQLIEDPTWTSLARLCIIRAALVELGTWCSSELEGEGEGEGKGQDHARLMFAHIAAAVEDRTDGHPLFRTIALDNLTVFIKRHKLSREERVKSFGKLFYEIVWAPTAHDTTGSNRSMVKAATEALILSLWDSDEAVARELLLTSAARTMGPRGDASRVPLWANVLPLIGSRGLVEAARLSSMDIPAEASDDKVVGLLWAYLAKVAIEDRLASARVSDAAEAFLETMWKEETTGFGPTEIAQAADKWATKWLPSVLAAFPSISVGDDPEADEKMDHIVTVLDERILRHASNQGVQATAALVRQLDTLFPNDERSMTCSLMFLKRLNEKEMDTLVPLLPAQDPIAMVRNASVHPSKMVKMQAMAVLVQMRRTFPDGLADFVRANLLDIPVLYSESFWKFLAKWTNGLQKTVAKSVPGLRRLAMDTLSRPSADPRRKTIGLKILGIIGFDPSEKLLVPTLLNVVSRDLLEVNRTMACDLLVGFEGEGSDAVFTAQKSVIEFERWVVYAKLLLAHRRALERLRGAMLIRTLGFYLAGLKQDEPFGKIQTQPGKDALFPFVDTLIAEARQTLADNTTNLETMNPRLHGILYSIQLVVSTPRSPLGSGRRLRGGILVGEGKAGLEMPLGTIEVLVELILETLKRSLFFFGSTSYTVGETEFEGEDDEDGEEDEQDGDEDDEVEAEVNGTDTKPASNGDVNGTPNGFSFQNAVRNTRLISTNIWWRAVKAAAALSALCVENLAKMADSRPLPDPTITRLMDALMEGLLTIRHWGASASMEQAFTKVCSVVWRLSETYHAKIFDSIDKTVAKVDAGGPERLDHRYAGISRILLGIMRGTEKSKQVADYVRNAIWKIGGPDVEKRGPERDSARINTLNVLIWIFKDTVVGPLFPLEEGFQMALEGMASPNVNLNRVATSLFAHALIPRGFSDVALHKHNVKRADIFFRRNRKLLAVVGDIVSRAADSGDFTKPELYAALVLLSRLAPFPADEPQEDEQGQYELNEVLLSLSQIADGLEQVLQRSRIEKAREMAGTALWAVVPEEDRKIRLERLSKGVDGGLQNAVQGVLYAFEYLGTRMDTKDTDAVLRLLELVEWPKAARWNVAAALRLCRRLAIPAPEALVETARSAAANAAPGVDQVRIELVHKLEDNEAQATFKQAANSRDWESILSIVESGVTDSFSSATQTAIVALCMQLVSSDPLPPRHVIAPLLDLIADPRFGSDLSLVPSQQVLFQIIGKEPKDTDLALPSALRLLAAGRETATEQDKSAFAELARMGVTSEERDLHLAVADALRKPATARELGTDGSLLSILARLLLDKDDIVRDLASRSAQAVLGLSNPGNATLTLPLLIAKLVEVAPQQSISEFFSLKDLPDEFASDDSWNVNTDFESALQMMEAAFVASFGRVKPSSAELLGLERVSGPEKRGAAAAFPMSEHTGCVRYFYEYRRKLVDGLASASDEVVEEEKKKALERIKEEMRLLVFRTEA